MTSAEELYERTAELDALQSGLARARSGRGQVIVAMGPAGIGKTRLLTEAGRMAAADCDVAVARADSLHQHLPFAVMRQLLQPLVTQLSASQRQCRMSPAASRALQDVTDSAALPQAEEGVTESLLALTFELCKDKPLVFVVDDLQWADTASVKFLFHLLPLIERQRCCVIAALDDNDEDAPALLNTITADRRCHLLRLSSLGPQTIATIVEASSACSGSPPPDPSFLHACHSATAGNPLFLGELLRLLAREQAAPSADTVARLAPVNAQTVQDRVRTALEQLPKDSGSLTRAAAALGPSPSLAQAARLADMPLDAAQQAMEELRRADRILDPTPGGDVRFVHPLVHAAVYDAVPADESSAAHGRAAALLRADGQPEEAAVHLLRTLPGGGFETVHRLLQAAELAWARGSPEAATVYLRRCVAEPPDEEQRASILYDLGRSCLLNDAAAAADDLDQAYTAATHARPRAEAALALGEALLMQQRSQEAMEVWQHALAEVAEDTSLFQQIQACVLSLPLYDPSQPTLRRATLRQIAEVRSRATRFPPGGTALDCVVAGHDAVLGDPRAVSRALHALHGPSCDELADLPGGEVALALGWLVLISGDQDAVLASLDRALAHAHRTESLTSEAITLTYRAMAGLAHGNLAQAETDAQQAASAAQAASASLLRNVLSPVWADTLLERGLLEQAETALACAQAEPAPVTDLTYHVQCSRARLLRLGGHTDQALEAALAAGQSFTAAGGTNPALLPWMSEAAWCLHALGRTDEALDLAYEELRQARNWSAPRAWGRALRTLGLLQTSAADGLKYLDAAVLRLQPSPARLEYAKALADYAAALAAAGRQTEASQATAEALTLAQRCAAPALTGQIRSGRPADPTTEPVWAAGHG
ncbi:ATP-binding protein [Streptomyces sp. NBC_01614]|uniref:AAA family ATPase n=1 Tax=Streptomyces sp. NBC_00180 TaxID=2903632 RepID=A0AAU1ICP3_9ACTN